MYSVDIYGVQSFPWP